MGKLDDKPLYCINNQKLYTLKRKNGSPVLLPWMKIFFQPLFQVLVNQGNNKPMVQPPVITAYKSETRNTVGKLFPVNISRIFKRWNTNQSEKNLEADLQRAIVELDSQKLNPNSKEEKSVSNSDDSIISNGIGILIIDIKTGSILDANYALCNNYGYSYSDFIGLNIDSIFHPVSQQIFNEFVQPVCLDSAFCSIIVNTHFDGSIFYSEVFGTGILLDDQLSLIVFVRKIDNDSESNKLMLDWVRDLSSEQSKLTGIIQALSANLELDPDLVLDKLNQIIPFSLGVFLGIENDSMYVLATKGQTDTPFLMHIQDSEAISKLFSNNQPICIGKISPTDPTIKILSPLFVDCIPAFFEQMQSWLWIPIQVESNFFGCIGIAKEEKNFFNLHHSKLASIIGNQIALIMKNSDIYEKEQMAGALQERQNLAHNLHDTVNQSLFSAGLIAEVLPHLWDLDPVEGRRSLSDMYRLIRGAQAEIRMMLVDLRPTTLLDVEFCDLLNLLAKAFMGRTNIPIEVNVNGKCALPAKVQTACYHICQEALNNIAKHSGAKKARIFLHLDKGWIDLNIVDDGRGFDRRRKGVRRLDEPFDISTRDNTHGFNPKYIPFEHYGLRMMNEQAELIGATMKIVSQPGKGTQISLQWMGKI
jgi:signal transduction histidine kinase